MKVGRVVPVGDLLPAPVVIGIARENLPHLRDRCASIAPLRQYPGRPPSKNQGRLVPKRCGFACGDRLVVAMEPGQHLGLDIVRPNVARMHLDHSADDLEPGFRVSFLSIGTVEPDKERVGMKFRLIFQHIAQYTIGFRPPAGSPAFVDGGIDGPGRIAG